MIVCPRCNEPHRFNRSECKLYLRKVRHSHTKHKARNNYRKRRAIKQLERKTVQMRFEGGGH